jgi:hypothetical protein
MYHSRIVGTYLCACAVVAGLSGCADGGAKRLAVAGGVTWRGQPLDQGAIVFLPDDPSLGASGGAMVKHGRYRIPARDGLLPGRYKVMITSADPGRAPHPEAVPGAPGPLSRDRVHSKFNAQTVLVAEVTATGPNTFDFDVE